MRRRKQSDTTGCGLACIAILANRPYSAVREVSIAALGFDPDAEFYTSTGQLKELGSHFGIQISAKRRHQFKGWVHLPNSAILAINYKKDSES
jgi:ABC-type bacteriocin/lantibiotic exporter with double-glycine peptidase domain